MIDYAIEHAADLKGMKYLGKRKFTSIQFSSFNEFVEIVTGIVDKARNWHLKETDSNQPFITVAHDVCDGKKMQINGITMHFADPETLEVH